MNRSLVTDQRSTPISAVISVILAIFTLGYMLPWMIAALRGKAAHWGVFWVNLLLGWTFIGWLLALVWACMPHRALAASRSISMAELPHMAPPERGLEPRARVAPPMQGAAALASPAPGAGTGRGPRNVPALRDVVLELDHEPLRDDLEEQVEVVGETYRIKEVKRVFRDQGLPITPGGVTIDNARCILVPEPWNPHDPNAVAVMIGTHHVGYLPAELAVDYSVGLQSLARRRLLATGEARLWAKEEAAGMVRARVTVLIPEAHSFA